MALYNINCYAIIFRIINFIFLYILFFIDLNLTKYNIKDVCNKIRGLFIRDIFNILLIKRNLKRFNI